MLTAFMLRREPEAEPAPPPAPAPRAEPRLDFRRPPEDYATKPIHRNPVMGLPVSAPPAVESRPALALVPDPAPVVEPGTSVEPEPAAVSVESEPAESEPVDSELVDSGPAESGPVDSDLVKPELVGPEPAEPEPLGASEDLPVRSVALTDTGEIRRRYLRTFEATRRRTP
ncbi:hypothetical protein ACQPZF_34800 [Actinosynnema sp. CS-041913]|uniref:hypothetical protein n=1 Tax=Actinosynnema sp. CS-041913 TaxID=3239917 RepID=UPI003D8EDD28